MSLIANLFAPARSLKPATHTPPASPSPAADNAPSFSEALESARQPQQTPDPQPSRAPAATPPKPDAKLSRHDKKSSETDDATTDESSDDASTSDAPTASTPASTDEPANAATPTKPCAANAADDSTNPSTDPTAQQIATIAAAQSQPLPANQPLPLPETPAISPGVQLPTGQPAQTDPQIQQNTTPEQQKPSAPAVSTPSPKAANTQPQAAPTPSPDSPQPENPAIKQPTKRPAPLASTPAPAKKPDAAPSTNAASTRTDPLAASTPTADQPTPSPLAQHPNAKFANNTTHSGQSPDSPSTPAASPASTQSQPTPSDATVIAESIKSATPTTSDDSTPAAPQSNATPIPLTSANNTNHTIDNRAASAAPAQDSPHTTSDQTFDQIVLGLRTKMDATHSKAEISLNPPNLGTLHVSVSLQNGSLTAQFQSSSEVVRDLLKGNMEKLKSVLESQGVSVENLAVGAPQDKTELPSASPATAQTNQSANDGRSAGQYNHDSQNKKRSQDPGAFARNWQQATAKAPIDLVA